MSEVTELAPNHTEHIWPDRPRDRIVILASVYEIDHQDLSKLFGCSEGSLSRWLQGGPPTRIQGRFVTRIDDAVATIQILEEGFAADEIPEVLKHRFTQINDQTLSECIGTDRFAEVREFVQDLAASRLRRLRD